MVKGEPRVAKKKQPTIPPSTNSDKLDSLSAESVDNGKQVAVIVTDIGYIKSDISEIKLMFKDIRESYVTKIEFEPVKKIVYGIVGSVLLTVFGALLTLIITN